MQGSQRGRIRGGMLMAAALGTILLAGCTGPPAATSSPPAAGSSTTGAPASSGTSSLPATTGSARPASPAPPSNQAVTGPLTLYYVAFGDNGASGPVIGCGDSLVATTSAPLTYTDKLQAAMTALLANHSVAVGQSGLNNSLAQSSLALAGTSLDGGTATVDLSGSIVQGGECDAPRIIGQLRQTAATASGAATVRININGTAIEQALSLK